MKKIIFLLPILLIAFTAKAQYKWTPAVVTLTSGETHEGEARLNKKGYGFNVTMPTVSFKSKKDKIREKYTTDEVESILFTNTYKVKKDGLESEETSEDKFVPVDTRSYGKPVFLQELIVGKLSVYATPTNNYKKKIKATEAPFNKGSFSLVYLKKKDASATLITVLGLEGFLQEREAARYLSNCPITKEFIEGKEGTVNPVELARFYNESCN